MTAPPIILASQSAARRRMLEVARIALRVEPADIDERAVEARLIVDGVDIRDIAQALARVKAEAVSARHPNAFVIGSDQVLACEGRRFSKPRDLGEARAQLTFLRARPHDLHSAVALARNGATVWAETDTATLRMRAFSDQFLDDYLAMEGDTLLQTVGCYRVEDSGIQLFDKVDGAFHTIMGMPLLPLLAALRRFGVVKD